MELFLVCDLVAQKHNAKQTGLCRLKCGISKCTQILINPYYLDNYYRS